MSTTLLLLCIAYLIHLLIITVLGYKIIRHQDKGGKSIETKISVIIAARNEEKNLGVLIESIASQSTLPYELIIVNDRSADSTSSILETYCAQFSWLKVITIHELPEGWTGKKHTLNQAVKHATGTFLVFTDADYLPCSNEWIETLNRSMEEGFDVILGYSPYTLEKGFLNQFIQWETLMTGLQYLGMAIIGKPYMGVGRNLAIRKDKYDLELLASIKHLEGGDDDLMISNISSKEKTKVILSLKSQTNSSTKTQLRNYLKQKTRHLAAGKYYHQKDQTLLGIFTLSWMVSWGLLVYLITLSADLDIILMVFGIRSLFFYSIIHLVGQKLHTDIKIWALPFLDLCYCLYYPLVAIKALATNKVEWK